MYRVEFSSRAAREFRDLTPDIKRRIDPFLLSLAEAPRPVGCVKLSGEEALWRVRIGDYRIIYQITDQVLLVLVLKIGHRRDIYR